MTAPDSYDTLELTKGGGKPLEQGEKKMKRMTKKELQKTFAAINAVYGYERFQLSGYGWPAGSVLVCDQAGYVEAVIPARKRRAVLLDQLAG